MKRGPMLVTLTAALALARLGDREVCAWLLAHPEATERQDRHRLTALLKRFGPRCRRRIARCAAPALVRSHHRPGCDRSARHLPRSRLARAAGEHSAPGRTLEARASAARALGALRSRALAAARSIGRSRILHGRCARRPRARSGHWLRGLDRAALAAPLRIRRGGCGAIPRTHSPRHGETRARGAAAPRRRSSPRSLRARDGGRSAPDAGVGSPQPWRARPCGVNRSARFAAGWIAIAVLSTARLILGHYLLLAAVAFLEAAQRRCTASLCPTGSACSRATSRRRSASWCPRTTKRSRSSKTSAR